MEQNEKSQLLEKVDEQLLLNVELFLYSLGYT